MNTLVPKDEKLEALVENLRVIESQKGKKARWTYVEMYHEIGREIVQFRENFGKTYGDQIVPRVALLWGKHKRHVFDAVRFYESYPDLEELPGGTENSWRSVLQLLGGGEKAGKTLSLEEKILEFATPEVKADASLPYSSPLSRSEFLARLKTPMEKKPDGKIVIHDKKEITHTTNALMSFFKKTYGMKKMYGEKDVSRFACQRLFKEHGEEKVKQLIQAAHAVMDKPYAPVITSFLDLERKFLQLKSFYQRTAAKGPKLIKI